MAISVEPATPDRWRDLEVVMRTRGDPARCWCQYFRLRGAAWRVSTSRTNRAALEQQVRDVGPPPGVLGYVDGEPAGWCAVGPKQAYPRLLASRVASSEVDGVWAVTCFVVRDGWRGRGLARPLLDGAVELARQHGAAAIEAYPVDADAAASVSTSALYHGPLSVFLAAGFAETARTSPGRAVVRLD